MIERLDEGNWKETKWRFFGEIAEYTTKGVIKRDLEYRYLLIKLDGELEIYRRKLE